MNSNAFINHPEQPSDAELTAALGSSRVLWDKLCADLEAEQGIDISEWRCYSVKAGWSLRLRHKKRNIVYLAPRAGSFNVAFIFGDKALSAARGSKLPKRALKLLDEGTRYPEGTAIRLVVKKPQDVGIVKKLAAIKLAN